jgi:hypothetical protein
MGPTVCELEGPMPTLNRSKALMVIRAPLSVVGLELRYTSDIPDE